MKTLSLKLDETIFQETEELLGKMGTSRNLYINDAIDHYNKIQKRMMLEKILATESELVREESMKVLAEFESSAVRYLQCRTPDNEDL
jgi:predicted transcriptional regulator